MRVYVFENQTGRFVFAASSKPAKLPPELGPWTLFSSFELSTIGKVERTDLPGDQLVSAIVQDGFHLSPVVHKCRT